MKTENKLICGTMFAFGVSGACCLALGSLIPFLRETYNLSYDFAGMLVSLQSVGNLVAIGLMGFLPSFLGRRRSVLFTSVWMAAAYLLFTTGWGGAIRRYLDFLKYFLCLSGSLLCSFFLTFSTAQKIWRTTWYLSATTTACLKQVLATFRK